MISSLAVEILLHILGSSFVNAQIAQTFLNMSVRPDAFAELFRGPTATPEQCMEGVTQEVGGGRLGVKKCGRWEIGGKKMWEVGDGKTMWEVGDWCIKCGRCDLRV